MDEPCWSREFAAEYSTVYTYDLVGNRLTRTVSIGANVLDTTYAYDPCTDRLLSEVHTGPSAAIPLGNDSIYVYADSGGGFRYQHHSKPISQIQAFFMGIPSRWSGYGYYGALICLGLSFFMPMLLRFGKSLISKEKLDYRPRSRYGLFTRCVALLMAGIFLIGVDSVRNLAEGTVSYSQLSTLQWAKGGTTITYDYDDNGSLISKVSTGTTTETVTYKYNLQNRLQRVETTPSGEPTQVVEYVYNDAGIRVQKIEDPEGTPIVTTYLVNSYNPTGYAQVIEEITDDDGTITRRTYTIGDDVIAQSDTPGTAAATEYLLYDGHGSTRQLVDSSATVTDCYSYDAYGVMLGGNPTSTTPAATNLLYTGEQFDTNAQQYYLRARYYNPSNGRFNRMDDYSGNMQDPQSLHKYLYAHANPCNCIDPSGRFTLINVLTVVALMSMMFMIPGCKRKPGTSHYQKNILRVKIKPVMLKPENTRIDINLQLQGFEEALEGASNFWKERAGIEFYWSKILSDDRPEYSKLTTESAISKAVNSYYDGNPVVLVIEELDLSAAGGETPRSRNGMVIRRDCASDDVIAHEFAHMFCWYWLIHVSDKNNILTTGDNRSNYLSKLWMSQKQIDDARNYVIKREWQDEKK